MNTEHAMLEADEDALPSIELAEADERDTDSPFVAPEEIADPAAHALRVVEALLFAASQPVTEGQLAAQLPEGTDVAATIAALQAHYAGRGVNLVAVAGGYAFRTAPDLARHLTIYRSVTRRFSRAALESLAIIAYHQPITRAEIEAIRGVGLSRGTLDQLLEAGWIKPKGRRQVPGRPTTWVTTLEFLSHFGLDKLDDLPGIEELKAAGLLNLAVTPLPTDAESLTPEEGEEAEDIEDLNDAENVEEGADSEDASGDAAADRRADDEGEETHLAAAPAAAAGGRDESLS
jgi:segregation and condensation protein B